MKICGGLVMFKGMVVRSGRKMGGRVERVVVCWCILGGYLA